MIFIRSQLLKWGLNNPRYQLSMMRKKINSFEGQISNPFENRSFAEINRIISMNISQKNQAILCNFVLKTINQRIAKQTYKQTTPAQKKAKEQLLNRTFDKLLSRHLQNLTPQDILTILQSFYKINQIRYCRISQDVKNKIKNLLFNRIGNLLQDDTKGVHKDVFKQILYLMLQFKKKTAVLKDIIDYLSVHSLKTNQELINFFEQFSYLNRSGFYDTTIQPLLYRLMHNKNNTIENSHQWVKPIVLQVTLLYNENLRFKGNYYLTHFFAGLDNQLKNKRVSFRDRVFYLKQLFEWSQFSGPYFIDLDDSIYGIKLIYSIIRSLRQQLDRNQDIDFESFAYLTKFCYRFQDFAEISHKIIEKSQKQIMEELNYILHKSFQNCILNKFDKVTLSNLLQIINSNLQLPKEYQLKFNKGLIRILENLKDQDVLIGRIRLLQYVVKSIREGRAGIDKSQLLPILRHIEKKSKTLKVYEILRMYNIFRILQIQSKIFQEFFQYQFEKNQSAVVQNMSRTILKKYSYEIIEEATQNLKKSYLQNNKKQETITQVLWFNLKNVSNQNSQQNRDPIFIYWFHTNFQIFKKITKNLQNCQFIISNSISQLNFKTKGDYHSIHYQVFIELLKSWQDSNPNAKPEDISRFYLFNLKTFIQSEQIRSIFVKNYRHSFFIKSMWAFYKMSSNKQILQSYFKKMRSTKQLLILAKRQKPVVYRQKSNIRTLMLFKNISFLNATQQSKLKLNDNIVSAWFWANYHGYSWKFHQDADQGWLEDSFKKYLIRKFGYTMYVEYMIEIEKSKNQAKLEQITSLFPQTIIPQEIYNGTLTKQTQINPKIITELLMYKKTLFFLLKKQTNICQPFVQKIMQIKNPYMCHKIVQAANLVDSIKQHLTLPTRIKFSQWIKDTILNSCKPLENQSQLYLCLQFNINTPQLKPAIDNYVKQQLSNGNFNIAPLLYINGYTGISQSISKLLFLVNANRVFPFMEEIFKTPYLLLMNSLLGLVLNQKQQKLLQQFYSTLINEEVLSKVIKTVYQQKKQTVYQFYMLLQISQNRLSNSKSSKSLQIIDRIRNKLDTQYSKIRQNSLHQIAKQSHAILKLFGYQFASDKICQLPIQINMCKVIVHNGQPGYSQLAHQYVTKCWKIDYRVYQYQINKWVTQYEQTNEFFKNNK